MKFSTFNKFVDRFGCKLFMISLIAFVLTGCGDFYSNFEDLPPDLKMEQMFFANKDSFEVIVKMSEEDSKVIRIDPDFTLVSGEGLSTDTGNVGFSNQRWNEYKNLFKKVGLQKGIVRGEDGSVAFIAFSKGLAVSGISKGYLYSTVDKGCEKVSLDADDPLEGRGFVCKRLDANWSLFVWG